MIEKPCGLLSDPNGPAYFIGANAIFAIHDLPHGHQPLVQADGGVFHYGADLDTELLLFVVLAALPPTLIRQKDHFLGAASRACDAIGPALGSEIVQAVV